MISSVITLEYLFILKDICNTNLSSLKTQNNHIMINTQFAPDHMIALSAINEYILTTEENIVSCHSSGNYTEVHLEDGRKVVISKTLKDVERSFRTRWFVRVHHSHLINLKHAIKFLKKDGDRLLLDNGNEVMVSRSKKKDLMERIIHL